MTTYFRGSATLVVALTLLVRLGFVFAPDSSNLNVAHNPANEGYLSFGNSFPTGVGFKHGINEDQPSSQPVEFSERTQARRCTGLAAFSGMDGALGIDQVRARSRAGIQPGFMQALVCRRC